MLFVRGRVVRRRKTSWFLRRRSLTPWWAAEWSGGIIPCIIQEWKLTLSRDTPSIKGGCHNRVPAEGTQEWKGSETEGGILLVTAGVAGGLSDGVKWRAIPKSLLELATHYFNRWPWQSCVACGQAQAEALQNKYCLSLSGSKTRRRGLKV